MLQKKVYTSEIKGIDDKEMTLTAYVSTATIDRSNEILDPNGVDLTNYKKNPVVLWAHNYEMPPIGKALWVKRDGEGVLSKVKFASTEFAQEIFQLYKEGFLKAFSVGFIPKTHEDKMNKSGDNIRTFTKWEMLEYSAVPVPANPDAIALAMQKGFIKNEQVKKMFEVKEEEPIQEFNNEEVTTGNPEVKQLEVITVNPALDELMAEVGLKDEQIKVLEQENSELRYKLYTFHKQKQQRNSEITADSLAKEVEVIVGRVIRKAQGKV